MACDLQGTHPSPAQRIAACNYIVSLGERGNPNRIVYLGGIFGRGNGYCKSGQYIRGLADLDKTIEYSQQKHVAEVMLSNFYIARAKCRISARRFDEAMNDIDRSFEKSPINAALLKSGMLTKDQAQKRKDSWGANLRGDIAIGKGDYAAAEKYYEEAFKLTPNLKGIAEKLAAARELAEQKSPSKAPGNIAPVAPFDAGHRMALVIGNSKYRNVPVLANPAHDAEMVAAILKRTGFEKVTLLEDLDKDAMVGALRNFSIEAEKADWAVIYYAGHGMEVGGVNYLIPVDARLATDRDISFEAVPLDQVMNAAERADKLRLVILDACRDNPFKNQMKRTLAVSSRSVSRGLAPVEPDPGTLVVYAAKAGEQASDGRGEHGPFATAFAKDVMIPGLEVRRLFDDVRDDVLDATHHEQQPFSYGSISGRDNFYFIGPVAKSGK